jgi:dienelactone hydrolase
MSHRRRIIAGSLGVLLCLTGFAATGGDAARAISGPAVAVVRPSTSLLTQPLTIRLRNLPPGPVTIQVTSTDANAVDWASSARFRAHDGTLNLATADSLGGSYTGVQPMGLISELKPTTSMPGDLYWWSQTPASFALTASMDGKTLASTQFSRQLDAPGVTSQTETLADQGFVGQYWQPPAGTVRHPAVLEFGGSEGGLGGQLAGAALATAGYPTLDIAYFKAPGLPSTLSNIPLEYFRKALTWLSRRSSVDPQQIYVSGVSRGSEAAQLLGVYYPSLVHGVIAGVPSDAAICSYPGCTGPAWTLHGKPIPYTKQLDNPHPTDDPAAVIPVERIHGPVFLVCGGADKVWISCPYGEAIKARLDEHHDGYRHVLYSYPDAGHGVGSMIPYEPSQTGPLTSSTDGRYPTANSLARADVWPHLMAFMRRSTRH